MVSVMWDGGWGWGAGAWIGMAFMMFFWLMVLVGFVVLVVWLARGGGSRSAHSGTVAACDIARQRYARGEISKEQFEEICRTVGG